MKIVVSVKQICHIYARSGMDREHNFLTPRDRIYRVNPYDEVAMELAVHLKDSLSDGEIIVVTLGSMIAESEFRRCAAMGADHLYRIDGDDTMDPWSKSVCLARAIKDMDPDLILCGKESLDNRNGQVGAYLAYHLGMPFVSGIMDVSIENNRASAMAQRKAGRGIRELMECPLPAVLSVDLGGHEPRLPSWEDKKRARSMPIRVLRYPDGIPTSKTVSKKSFPPRPRPKRVPAPDCRLPAFYRIEQLLAGSRVEKKGEILTGRPESQAEGIISFLQRHGFLKLKKGEKGA